MEKQGRRRKRRRRNKKRRSYVPVGKDMTSTTTSEDVVSSGGPAKFTARKIISHMAQNSWSHYYCYGGISTKHL